MPTLTWARQDGQRMVFNLEAIENTIGRELGNPVRIESGYVSKRHAVIRFGQQGYTIADMNSANGTTVNGQRVTSAVLKDGDRIGLGAEVLVFSNLVARTPAPSRGTSGRNPIVLAVIGGGITILLVLVLIVAFGGSSRTPSGPAANTVPMDPGTMDAAPASEPGVNMPSLDVAPPVGAGPAPIVPGAGTIAGEMLPSQDPAALYEMAWSHVRGKRLVEARRLLEAALRLSPNDPSIQQRLREVEATIVAPVDQHLSAGQRSFVYLRYQDAILEWEQVLSLTVPSDPRYQQAAAGIQRARERLSR
jgi:pSer/pThr/pTyr-binding forkhead associated (FHA) protein